MIYKGEHSVTFDDKNSWIDFHLVPLSRPVIAQPAFKDRYVDISGRSGAGDLGSLLTGGPTYGDRIGSIEFLVDLEQWSSWAVAYSTILTHLHGQTMRMTLADDPEFYYEGRFTVNQWQSGASFSTVTIDYNVQPFKIGEYAIGEDWFWDPFSFETGVINEDHGIIINPPPATNVHSIEGYPFQREIVFVTSSDMSVIFDGISYLLPTGRSSPYGLVLKEGPNILEFIGDGTVDIRYKGGYL